MRIDDINKKMEEICKCTFRKSGERVVLGKGNPQAEIVFVGEAPGKNESEKGEPFIGASGKILDSLLSSIEMDRDEVYITNIVKYRPPDNRDPTMEEIADCFPWLIQEIACIKPKIIAPLGRHALAQFVPGHKISDAHGQIFHSQSKELGKHTIYALYHPAAALYNGKLRQTLFDDFAYIPQVLKEI